jgi:hypothetical protein
LKLLNFTARYSKKSNQASSSFLSSLLPLTCLLRDMHTGVFGLSTATMYAPTVSLPSAGLKR